MTVGDDVVLVEQGVGLLLVLGFLALYLGVVRYRRKPRSLESWYMIGKNTILAMVLGLGVATQLFGLQWPGRTLVRITVFALILAWLGAQFALLVDSIRGRHTGKDPQ